MYNKHLEKYSNETMLSSRCRIGSKFLTKKINYYDNFITDKKEFIILPKYLDSEQILLPSDFNQTKKEMVFLRTSNEQDTIISQKHFLVLMTLFYVETNEELEQFYQYYRTQGVEKFFMFYNGKLNERENLPVHMDIEYIEWDFVYWTIVDGREYHHAQEAALTTFYHKYSNCFDYVITCDTDEYIYIENDTIKNLLKIKYENFNQSFWVPNRFCYIDWKNKSITSNEKIFDNPTCSKCIHASKNKHSYFTDKTVIPIHGMNAKFNIKMEEAVMYHTKQRFKGNKDGNILLNNFFS